MRQRRNSDTDDQLLDEKDGDNSSSSSEPGNCNWKVLTGIFIVQVRSSASKPQNYVRGVLERNTEVGGLLFSCSQSLYKILYKKIK
jgi:hypothetical protein